MKPELREKILAYNKQMKEKREKADDLERILDAFSKIPLKSIKALLPSVVVEVLERHGIIDK